MPCYQIRNVSVEFRVENIDLLKRALEKAGWPVVRETSEAIQFRDRYSNPVTINLSTGKMTASVDEKQLSEICNFVKRRYSEVVIDEVAKRQKWIKKNMGANRYQLQRF
jgi:hypothetical protein